MSIEGTSHLRSIINRWDQEFEDTAPLDDLCELLRQLDLLTDDVKAYRSRVEQVVAKVMDTKLHVFAGGTAEYKGGSKRSHWDHPLLAGELVETAMEQGERPQEALLACAGIGYWRAGELRKRGLDPDKFCDVDYGPPHVVIRANEEKAE